MITNSESGTRVDEIADGIYRICTPIHQFPGGFTFNQYLIIDDEPLLFHTGPRGLFPLVRGAIDAVLPAQKLRHIALSHIEADECGGLNNFLAIAPEAAPLCGDLAAMLSVGDMADRPPQPLADGASKTLGQRTVTWIATPHLPHGWECGYLFETRTRTLLCGDLFTQAGAEHPALTESDILEPSEALRARMDYYSHTPSSGALLGRLAELQPTTLACMHGPAWRGDGAALLCALAERVRPVM